MTRIASLSVHPTIPGPADGLKGRLFCEKLTGCDLWVGPNGAGKSIASVIAVVAALEGLAQVPTDPRRPYLGPPPSNTSITVTLADGDAWRRDLAARPGTARAKAANEAALELVGALPTAWDLSDFTRSTPEQRGSILDAAARAGGLLEGWDAAGCQARVASLLEAGDTEEKRAYVGPLDDLLHACPTARTGAGWIEAAIVWAESEQKIANADQVTAEGAWQHKRGEVPPEIAGNPAQDSARREELMLILAEQRGSADRRRQAQHTMARSEAEGLRLSVARQAQEAEGKRLSQPTPRPILDSDDGLRANLAQANAEVDAALAKADEASKVLLAGRAAASEAAGAVRAAQAGWDEARSHAYSVGVARRTLAGLSAGAACVHCGAADPLDVAARIADTDLQVEAAERDVATATCALTPLAMASATSATAATRAELEHARLTTALQDREQEQRTAHDRLEGSPAQRERANEAHRQRELTREQGLQEARQRWVLANAGVQQWATAHAVLTIPPEPDAAREVSITDELSDIHARDVARARAASYTQELATLARRYEALYARWMGIRALIGILRQVRDELAAAAFRPLEKAAQALLADAPGLPAPFFRGPDDYGATIHGREVPYHGLSESEARITAAALVYALAVISAQPCRLVILDGLEVVQADHRGPLLAALSRGVAAGLVDNVLVTCATASAEEERHLDVVGVNLHRPDAVATPRAAASAAASTAGALAQPDPGEADCPPF